MSSVRATGLTFAPEAGTQRMRDVINKNVTEEDIAASAEKIFSRGWSRMKLLLHDRPADRGGRGRRRHRADRRAPQAPRTQDPQATPTSPCRSARTCPSRTRRSSGARWTRSTSIERKQTLLRDIAQRRARDAQVSRRRHQPRRGHPVARRSPARRRDRGRVARRRALRRLGRAVLARSAGTRRSTRAASMRELYLVDAARRRAPAVGSHRRRPRRRASCAWEYRRALKDRVSPPCGKPKGTLLHPRTIEDAEADARKLVCFDCGIACDLTQMKEERLVALRKLDAHKPTVARRAAPRCRCSTAITCAGAPRRRPASRRPTARAGASASASVGRGAFISHLDTMRLLIRVFRRARVEMIYSKGFHPEAAADVRAGARARRRGARRILRREDRLRRRRRARCWRGCARRRPRAWSSHAVRQARRRGSGDLAAARSRRLGGVAAVGAGDAAHRGARGHSGCRSAS